jgi:branched-chain amino acid transport system permease protein
VSLANPQFWVTQLFNGVSYGALLFLLAGGLTLIFGMMRIVNMTHGSHYLLGAYLAVTLLARTGSYVVALAGAAVLIAVLGIIEWDRLIKQLSGQELGQVLTTMGLALIFQDVALVVWGGDPYQLDVPRLLSGRLSLGAYSFPVYRLFIIAVAAAVAVTLWLVVERTRVGAMMRAAVDDAEMARGVGINVSRISLGVFALGAALAAVAGVVAGGFLGFYPGADFEILSYAFVVVIVGGMGSLRGALLGSLLVGLLDNFGKALFPELSYFTLFAPMAAILAVRPTGLFGRA